MRSAFFCSFLFLSTFLHAQVDSLRIYCQKQFVSSVQGEDMLWMFRQRDTLRALGNTGTLDLRLNGENVGLVDSRSLRYLASIQDVYPALDSIWKPYLLEEIKGFDQQKDSLSSRLQTMGWQMRYLSSTRNLKRQQQLNSSGRSKVLLSFHNFQLAADVGLYSRRRYLKRSPRYSRMGREAKGFGMYWGGDFVGFPDPGHVQRFANSAALIDKYPALSFEFERYRDSYQQVYETKKSIGREDLVQDTEALLISMNRQRIGKVCACQYAMMPVLNLTFGANASVWVDTLQNWVFIKPNKSNGYFYSLGRWAYVPKN